MKMNDEIAIAAPREQVFAALNDVEILKQAIPGCQELEKQSDTELTATVMAKVGPVKAKFKGAVTLSDLNPPESYSISGEGKGGAAGFASGGAKITLREDGVGTILAYEVEAQVGGKLAQIGSRLVDGTAKKLAGEFFENFNQLIGESPEEGPEQFEIESQPLVTNPSAEIPGWTFVAGLVVIAVSFGSWLFLH